MIQLTTQVNNETKSEIFSGTLIEFSGKTFFLSSGHHVEYFHRIFELEAKREVMLVDSFGYQAKHRIPIPFHLELEKVLHIDNRDLGLDFCLIEISDYYLKLLSANNVQTIKRENWINQNPNSFSDRYGLIGLPSDLTSTCEYTDDFLVSSTFIAIDRAASICDESDGPLFKRFEGIHSEGLDVSLKGTSGGAIFGYSVDGKFYWIVAIQSSWLQSERKVFGCSLPLLAQVVETAMSKAEKG